MSKTLYENLLKKFKKANVARRSVISGTAGYDSPEEYQAFLEKQINSFIQNTDKVSPKKAADKTKEKPTIYVVDILDCSASMRDKDKIDQAVIGVNRGIEALKKDNEVNYSYGLCTFSENKMYKFDQTAPVKNQKTVTINQLGGWTALYDAIKRTVESLLISVPDGEKVLVNIYTDGSDNQSSTKPHEISSLIKKAEEKGYTVTFVGTEGDVAKIIKNISIDESNTLSYDGTGAGLASASAKTVTARAMYSKAVLDGEDVSKNFYSKVKL